MNLKFKKDAELVGDIQCLVQLETETTIKILHYLREIEIRHIYLERAYSSLFVWAVKELKYSDGATQRRIQSMRLLKTFPELEGKIESGDLSLSVASQTQTFFRREDQRRKKQAESKLTIDAKREIAESLVGTSTRQCERMLATISPDLVHKEKLRPISDDKTLVQFVANSKLMGKLERLKALMAHKNYDGRLDILIEELADQARAKYDAKPRFTSARAAKQTRHISAALQRTVRKRDQESCTYRDLESGNVCGSKHAIEFDHLNPYSMDGEHSLENLTLRCRAHNQHSARKLGILWE